MKNFLILIALGYLILCAFLYLYQRALIYFPQPARPVNNAATVQFFNKAQSLQGWIVNPGKNKALIYYGGNAESVEFNIEFFRHLLPDWSVYLVPYRGYGNNAGTPQENGLYSDALSVFDEVKADHSQVSLMGRSLGTGVATYVAAERSISSLILVTPFDSLVNVAQDHYPLFPIKLLLKDRFASVERAEKIKVPIFIIIAGKDEVIRLARSNALIDQLNKELTQQLIIPQATHNDLELYQHYGNSIQQFLAQE